MKAISLWQPWASAIALGLKHNETRSWATNYRGPIAIHASKRDTGELRQHFNAMLCHGWFWKEFKSRNLHSFALLPKGAIVAVGDLVDVLKTEVMLKHKLIGDIEMELGDYGINRFVWRLENVRRIEQPYHVVGRQGLFEVPDL